nr:3a protein [Bat coronavirus]
MFSNNSTNRIKMFLGLFQYTWDRAVDDITEAANLTVDAVQHLEASVVPLRQASNLAGFLLTSCFIYYFALFKASNLRRNAILLAARVLLLLIYTPVLFYCGAILDGIIVAGVLIARLALVSFYAWRYSNVLFIILNSTTLAFLHGHATYYDG